MQARLRTGGSALKKLEPNWLRTHNDDDSKHSGADDDDDRDDVVESKKTTLIRCRMSSIGKHLASLANGRCEVQCMATIRHCTCVHHLNQPSSVHMKSYSFFEEHTHSIDKVEVGVCNLLITLD